MACTYCGGKKTSVTVVGCGSWGTTLACIVAENIKKLQNFDENVKFWVFNERDPTGFKLTDTINNTRHNTKYAPTLQLPENIHAVSDLPQAVSPSNFLIFAVPNYFLVRCCKTILGKTRGGTEVLILVKSLDNLPGKSITIINQFVTKILKVPCSVVAGINLPVQYKEGQESDLTIGCRDLKVGGIWKSLLENNLVRVTLTTDIIGVELCVGLRNIIAFAAGYFDAFNDRESFKASAIRIGINDMIRYIDYFYPQCSLKTIFLSCGLPETIMLCYGSLSRRLGEALVIRNQTIAILEKKYMDGTLVPGPRLARKIYMQLREAKVAEKYPLFVTVCQYLKYQDRYVLFDLILKTRVDVVHPDRLVPL